MNDITILNGSDPAGKIILSNDKIYRGIHKEFIVEYAIIYNTCLHNDLFGRYIIKTKIADDFKLEPFALLFEHERVKPYIYPFEWTLSMIIDAAYTALNLVISLDKIGLGLKDGHQFNIAYHKGSFYWIDFGSIIQFKTLSWMFEEFIDAFINSIICKANGVHGDNIHAYLTDEDEREYTSLRAMILQYAHVGEVFKATQLLQQWIKFYEMKITIIPCGSKISDSILSFIVNFVKEAQIKQVLLISGNFTDICHTLNQNDIAVTVFNEDPGYIDFIYSQIKGKTTNISPVFINFSNPNGANSEPRWSKAEMRFPAEMVIVFHHFSTMSETDFVPLVKKLKLFTLRYAAIEVVYPCNSDLITAIKKEFDIITITQESYHNDKRLLFVKVK
jgi:hypothetical protein